MTQQNASLIVAASANDVIGVQGRLPWHLSADLKRFRKLTTGHHIILGRKSFESIGRLLPDRTTIIVTRNRDYSFAGAIAVDSLPSALAAAAADEQPFIAGGAEIYRASLPFIHTIYLTRVHAEIAGDTILPDIDWTHWILETSKPFAADSRNEFNGTFETYHRLDWYS